MKKIKKIIFCLMLLVFPMRAFALSGSLSVSCSASNVKAGDEVQCTVSGNSDDVVIGLQADAAVSGSAKLVSFTKSGNNWHDAGFKSNGYTIYANTEINNLSGNFTVGTLVVKIDDEVSESTIGIEISNVILVDSDGNEIENGVTGGSTSFAIAADDPTPTYEKGLKSLDVRNGVLSPAFSARFSGGSILLDSENTTTFGVYAEANNPNVEVICKSGNDTLDCTNITFKASGGNRTMAVNLVVDDEIFPLLISKPVNGVPELSSLVVGGKTVELVSGKVDGYVVTLDNLNNYSVEWKLKDEDNYYVTNFGQNPTTHSGNVLAITIEPKDKSKGLGSVTYNVQVNKTGTQPPASSSNKPVNPPTGGSAAVVMALVLVVSLGVSVFLYQKNIQSYN